MNELTSLDVVRETDRRVALADVKRVEGLLAEIDEKIAVLQKRRDSYLKQIGASSREAQMLRPAKEYK